MSNWTDWEIIRHQVALCGRVVDERGRPIENAVITLTETPAEFEVRIKGTSPPIGGPRDGWEDRPGRTRTDFDGIFYFLDLPPGQYTVHGTNRRTGARAQSSTKISWNKDETVEMAIMDLKLLTPE